MRVSASLTIDRPIEDIFACVATPFMMERWITGISGLRSLTQGRLGAGTRLRGRYTLDGETHETTWVLTAYEAPYYVGLKTESGPLSFSHLIELIPTARGVQVTSTLEVRPALAATPLFARLLAHPIRRLLLTNRLRQDLTALDRLLTPPAIRLLPAA